MKPKTETSGISPITEQYAALRSALPADVILLFQMGAFYEVFGEDARTVAAILKITLTKRGETLTCGVPYHTLDTYAKQLVKAGKRVAIAEQVGMPKSGEVMKRKIVKPFATAVDPT